MITTQFPNDYANLGDDGVDDLAYSKGWVSTPTANGNVWVTRTDVTPVTEEELKTAIDALAIAGVTTTIE